MSNDPAAARHFCRAQSPVPCAWHVEPGPGAHRKTIEHRATIHGLVTPTGCAANCGFRAHPFEGRYTISRRTRPCAWCRRSTEDVYCSHPCEVAAMQAEDTAVL